MKLLLALATVLLLQHAQADHFKKLYKDYGKHLSAPAGEDVGDVLILTPFIQNGSIAAGQKAALVVSEKLPNIESYAGYFTVDEAHESNMWFWFFPSAGNASSDPVVLWLNGGPGASSLNGLFDENGPFIVDENYTVSLREYSWHKNQSVIFLDNPVGVGFSFTNNGLAENETKVGSDAYSALYQFFQLFPEYQNNQFFLSGESYAGKYLPAIGYTILKQSPSAELKLNLQGILIGDGWSDPINQLNYGPFVYNAGLVSAKVAEELENSRRKALDLIAQGNWLEAESISDDILDDIEESSDVNIYNYLINYDDPDVWVEFLSTSELRKAIHVGDVEFGDKGAGEALQIDQMQSVAPWVEELLENYRVLIYTGQVDIIVGYPMTLDYLSKLNFTGAEELANSDRSAWYVDEEPAGYVRTGGNLTELLVRNSGHMVPRDQPKSAYDMLIRFTRGMPFA